MTPANNSLAWTCHARPARLGHTCGHVNATGGMRGRMLGDVMVCCESCGCTKHASDQRREEAAKGSKP